MPNLQNVEENLCFEFYYLPFIIDLPLLLVVGQAIYDLLVIGVVS